MSNKTFSTSAWDARHFAQQEEYVRRIDLLYRDAIREATRLAAALKTDPSKPFSFDDFPITAGKINTLLAKMAGNVQATITAGQESGWQLSNLKNDALVSSVLDTSSVPPASLSRYMARNLDALKAFQARKVGGLGLSDRVWRQTGQFKTELELGLDIGLGEGKSAAQLSRDIRAHLNEPNQLFHRVRSKHGNLALSKAATAYHPGQGVYRSSYKNAMRLTRTEINQAYRESDHTRWKQLDFVVGFEVRRSNNTTYGCDVCESLKGRYPKDFKFVGWHPQCRCHAVSILASADELRAMNRMVLKGESTEGFVSVNAVTDTPDGFKGWINNNRQRLATTPAPPLFLQTNTGFFNLRPTPPPTPTPVPPVPPAPTAEQILLADPDFQRSVAAMQKRTDLPKKLSLLEAAAVNSYSRTIYYDLNRYLRGSQVPNTDLMDAMSETLSAALQKLPSLKKDVYRGVSLSVSEIQEYVDALKNATPVTFSSYTSTSLDPGIAFGGNVKFIISGKRGKLIQKISHFPGEREVLFDKGTRFEVKGITPTGSMTLIELTEI